MSSDSERSEDNSVLYMGMSHTPKTRKMTPNRDTQVKKRMVTVTDPDFLLNHSYLGVEMIIPTNGRNLQIQGGFQVKRLHATNPVLS